MYKLLHRHYKKKYFGIYRHARKLFVIDMFLLASTLVLLGLSLFFFFWEPSLADKIDLKISLGGERILNGEDVCVSAEYKNKTELNLHETILALHLPDGFVIDRKKTPEEIFSNNSTFDLGTLEPGARSKVEVCGTLWLSIEEDKRIDAILSYKPEEWDSKDQKLSSYHLKLSDSVIETTVSKIPEKSFPSSQIPVEIKIKNNSEKDLEGIMIEQNWIEFNFEQETENLSLKSGEEMNIKGEIISPSETGEKEWNLSTWIKINGNLIKLDEEKNNIEIFYPEIRSSLEKVTDKSYITTSDEFEISAYWKNTSEYSAENLELLLSFEPNIIDLKATAIENGLKIENGYLVVDKTKRTALSAGEPNTEDKFNLNLKTLPYFNINDITDAKLKITPVMRMQVAAIEGQVLKTAGKYMEIPVATEVVFEPEIRYYTDEGDQLGRGSLPPKVGETTKYWVFVKARNTTSELKNIKFSATLADNVNFTGKQSVSIGNPISYNDAAKTMFWEQNYLPAHSQTGLYFEVEITPTKQMLGDNINLIKTIYLTGEDSFTGKKFEFYKNNLNNILPNTDRGSSKGSTVRP